MLLSYSAGIDWYIFHNCIYPKYFLLWDNKVISIKPEFHDLLKAKAIKNRYNKKQPTLLTHQLKTAAKELRNHPNITLKIADKSKINNLISHAKLISSSKAVFYKEVENIKQALINNGFPNYIVDEQIKCMIKNVNQQNKPCSTSPSQQTYIKLFYCNQMHYNYKSDEKILKTLIHRNILPIDPNKKIKLIYYNNSNTSNLVSRNNSSPSVGVLQKTNVIYQFKRPLGNCISDNNNIYVGLTSTTLSRRLTMHLADTSSISQHLKKHSCPTTELQKILTDNTTILEHQNNKQKLQILEVLHIRNMQLTLNRINFQTSANVLKCL